ncbi:MAG TPA: Gfo/Idh/MocA family oxidoreductase [Vicinamibacterales bacterium]|nr:Gfo/Idh/MocA family oxidoreductase [Vicinamibacterales bacterium]
MQPLQIGLIGAGKIGRLRARSIVMNPNTRLVAVMDPSVDAARAVAAAAGAAAATELEPFLAHELDAVVISSPSHTHEEPCLLAFSRGLHVLCEKPLSNTVESCRRIVDAAMTAKRALAVGFNLRYYPVFDFLKQTIARGEIGKIDHVRVFGGHEGLPKFAHEWEYKAPMSGGGALMDVGIHMTDLTRYVLGEITEVSGVATESIWRVPGSEDNAMALFRNPEGVTAIYHATWTEWKGYGIAIEAYGDKGMVRGAYAPMRGLLITQDRPGGPQRVTRQTYLGIQIRERLKTWQSTALQSFCEELDDFVALTRGDTGRRIADGFAGLRSVEIAHAIRQSTETHASVSLPPLGVMPAIGGRAS